MRKALADEGADTLVVSRLESTAWLTNLRANDLPHTPFALAFTLITPDKAELFINAARVPRGRTGETDGAGLCHPPL